MKNSQLSLEFVLLFSIVFFVFISVFTYAFNRIDENSSAKEIAQKNAEEIKTEIITASLSFSDYESNITTPDKIKNIDVELIIVKAKECELLVVNKFNNQTLAYESLPYINELESSPKIVFSKDKGTNLIIKKFENHLSIKRE
ncbi:hypothetical protein GF327_08340 [Candidatus Woesearchaeota archaeon]|nr:hypothetical protein [Candidatus Woesearchaeota archaeon]